MLIIYFLLGLGVTTAHSDYGVSFRAQNFDETVQNIDKEAYIKHQREKRLVTGYFVPQNVTNRPSWGSNNSRDFVANFTRFQNRHWPSGYNGVVRNTNTEGSNNQRVKILAPYGNMTDVTEKYFNPRQDYNINATWPVHPNYITVGPRYNNNFNNTSNAIRYDTVPVNPATPGHTLYPGYPGYPAPNTSYPAPNTGYPSPNTSNHVPNTGYPASNTGNLAPNTSYPSPHTGYPPPNTVYPAPHTGYPASNTGYPAPNTGHVAPNTAYPTPNTWYPASNTGYPAPNTGYPAPNTWYPASNTGYPAPNTSYPAYHGNPVPSTFYPAPSSVIPTANVTGFVPKPNPGFTIHDAVPRNNSYGFGNDRNGSNNTASLANCKCNLPRVNSTITKEERTMDACMITCNNCPAGMKMSDFGVCVKDLDDDDE